MASYRCCIPEKGWEWVCFEIQLSAGPVVGDDGSVETVVGMFEENEEGRNRKN